jgi:hypothetical protein
MRAGTRDVIGKGLLTASRYVLAVAALFVCSALNANAGDSLTCYKGDKDNRITIGEIAGADFRNAADECNSFYADCNGECYGCYLDEDSSREVCVDNQGKEFTP